MHTYTPGPWATDDNGEVDTSAADLTAWDGILSSGEVVAYCHPDNASLIAAAPVMLAALRLASVSCGFKKLNTVAQKLILSAIAKAEGSCSSFP